MLDGVKRHRAHTVYIRYTHMLDKEITGGREGGGATRYGFPPAVHHAAIYIPRTKTLIRMRRIINWTLRLPYYLV